MSEDTWFHPMTPEQAAQHAQQLMDDPLWVAAINEIRRDAVATWEASKQPDQREQQWHMVAALQRLNEMLMRRLEEVKVREHRARVTRN
jgi:hypothetical protein